MILRPGGVTREELGQVPGRPVKVGSPRPARVPGQHALHDAPRARVVLVEPQDLIGEAARMAKKGERVGVFLPRGCDRARRDVSAVAVPDSMAEYARRLDDMLRELDQRGCSVIIASLPPEERLGLAIADRRRCAAGLRGGEQPREDARRFGENRRARPS